MAPLYRPSIWPLLLHVSLCLQADGCFGGVQNSVEQGPYSVLGISPTATSQEVRQAFRRQAACWHPDKWAHKGSPHDVAEARERFSRVQEAYDALQGMLD